MNIKPIRNAAIHKEALSRINELMDLDPPKTSEEGGELEILIILVEKYEEARFPIDVPDPIEAILFMMDQRGFERSDIEPIFGSRSKASEVLGRKRHLSINMIRRAQDMLQIPAEVLVKDYGLS